MSTIARRSQKSNAVESAGSDVIEGVIVEESAELPRGTTAVIDRSSYLIRDTESEIIALYIPAGVNLKVSGGGARILVLGNVEEGSSAAAKGGGACIHIIGNVAKNTRIAAVGGSSHVLIVGSVDPSARIGAQGGGARIELLSSKGPIGFAEGGGAEVLYFG